MILVHIKVTTMLFINLSKHEETYDTKIEEGWEELMLFVHHSAWGCDFLMLGITQAACRAVGVSRLITSSHSG